MAGFRKSPEDCRTDFLKELLRAIQIVVRVDT